MATFLPTFLKFVNFLYIRLFSSSSVIFWVGLVQKITVVGDWHLESQVGSNLQSQDVEVEVEMTFA